MLKSLLSKPFFQKASYLSPLSVTLAFSLALFLFMPTQAFGESSAVSSNDQTYDYDYTFEKLLTNTQQYYIYAGNVGDSSAYEKNSSATTSVADNNSFFVKDGASIESDDSSSSTSYEVHGAAAHIALYGQGITTGANGNYASVSGGYITSLNGAYININTYVSGQTTSDNYVPTTVNYLAANNNQIDMTGGTVGLGYNASSGTYSIGKYLAAAYVKAMNINSDAQFLLDNNSVSISGGTVTSSIGNDVSSGALTGAYVYTILGNATMSNNSVTVTGGYVKAPNIFGATFYGDTFESTSFGVDKIKEISEVFGFNYTKSSATMFNNSVNIVAEDFEIKGIAGAYANVTDFATMYGNTVNITGGTFAGTANTSSVLLNSATIAGAYIKPTPPITVSTNGSNGAFETEGTVNMNAYNNSVTVTGGDISASVAGAAINSQQVSGVSLSYLTGNLEYNGTISNNTVNIYGGTINEEEDANGAYNGIYGGIYQGMDSTSTSGYEVINTYSITYNTVNIGFDAILGDNLSIGGGAYNASDNTDIQYFTLTPNVNTYNGNTHARFINFKKSKKSRK